MKPRPTKVLMPFDPTEFDGVIMTGWQVSEDAESAIRSHYHPGIFELHLVVRGRLSYLIHGDCHTLCAGDLLLIPPGTPHGTGEEPLGRCERFWLQIREPRPDQPLLGLPENASEEIARRLRRAPLRPFRGDEATVALFGKIRDAYADANDPLRLVNLRNLLLRVLLDFLALVGPDSADKGGAGIAKSIRLIEGSPASVSLAEMAKVAGMSESAFKLRFKKETGLPPVEYATRRRIELARRLLHTTARTVTELAHELGFSSSQHFATVFRRYTGRTPNEFRADDSAGGRVGEPVAGAGAAFNPLVSLSRVNSESSAVMVAPGLRNAGLKKPSRAVPPRKN